MSRITLPGISNCWQAPPPGWKLHKLRLRMSLAEGSQPGECKESQQATSCRDKRMCVQENNWAGRREFPRLHRVGLSSIVNSVFLKPCSQWLSSATWSPFSPLRIQSYLSKRGSQEDQLSRKENTDVVLLQDSKWPRVPA